MKKATARKASKTSASATRQSWTPALLATKKGVSPKAVRAFLRRHYDSPRGSNGWTITKSMADAVLSA